MKISNGNEMLQSFRQLQNFYRNCALLLKTGEADLQKFGWKKLFGNKVIADLSKHIEYPDYWVPHYAFIFLENENFKSLRVFLSVIFDIPEEPELISEPLVSAGIIDFGKNEDKQLNYNDATLHLWIPKRQDDGSFFSADPTKQWPDDGYTFSKFLSLAVPLTSITDAQVLKERVIQPLLDEIAKCSLE